MKKPRIKRNRKNYVFVTAPTIPAGPVLKHCPLPAELRHLEPMINGPFGTAILTGIGAALAEGFSRSKLEQVVEQIIEFYTQSYHRCAACLNWTDESTAGAVIVEGRFVVTALCPKCVAAGRAGRATESMARNMREHVLGVNDDHAT